MPDWTQAMTREYEYYSVNPGTWKDVALLDNVVSCSISRDFSADTLGSASLDVNGSLDESYVRVYLVTVQNGVREKFCLGTFLVQTSSSSFNGKYTSVPLDAYTPLIELKEKQPPLGYYVPEDANIMDYAYRIVRDAVRAPVVQATGTDKVYKDFVASDDDTWMTYTTDLLANAKMYLDLDEMGRVIFSPKQDTAALQPVWTFNDDNSSILQADIDIDRDLYGIPNVVEVIYSDDRRLYIAKAVNDDPNSPTSTIKRGREIPVRLNNPEMNGTPTQNMIDLYATQYLKEASTLEYTIKYSHGYCPVRVGDCVRMNYTRANLNGIKARVITQDITCDPSCIVQETATFQMKFWEG